MVQLFNPAQQGKNQLAETLQLIQAIGGIQGQRAQAGQRRELFPIQKQLSQTQLDQALFNLQQGRAQAPFQQKGLEARTGITQGQLQAQPGILEQEGAIRGKRLERLGTEAEASRVGLGETKRKLAQQEKARIIGEGSAQDVGALESEFFGIKRPGHTEISEALQSLEVVSRRLRGVPEVEALKVRLLKERDRVLGEVPVIDPNTGETLFLKQKDVATRVIKLKALKEKKLGIQKKETAKENKRLKEAAAKTREMNLLALESLRIDALQNNSGITDDILARDLSGEEFNELPTEQREAFIEIKKRQKGLSEKVGKLSFTDQRNLVKFEAHHREKVFGGEIMTQEEIQGDAQKLVNANLPPGTLEGLLSKPENSSQSRQQVIQEALRLQQSQGR